jgi:hypothetical protein
MYINKGYLVFFSDKGHIEVGFPDNKHYVDSRARHPDDTRYPNADTDNRVAKTTIVTIGAGSTTGYKSDNWATKQATQAFIYLEYLKF